jgi:hypothetical protein
VEGTLGIVIGAFTEVDNHPHLFTSLQQSFKEQDLIENCYFDERDMDEDEWDDDDEDRNIRTCNRTV